MTLLAAGAVCHFTGLRHCVAVKFPAGAAVGWVLVLEAMPEFWLPGGAGAHEAIIGAEKAAEFAGVDLGDPRRGAG